VKRRRKQLRFKPLADPHIPHYLDQTMTRGDLIDALSNLPFPTRRNSEERIALELDREVATYLVRALQR
jgi:hypothetical protein